MLAACASGLAVIETPSEWWAWIGLLLFGVWLPGAAPFKLSTTLLATTTEEFAGLLRRFYGGRIEGVHDDTIRERPTRLRRFLSASAEWVVALLIAIPIIAVILWLS